MREEYNIVLSEYDGLPLHVAMIEPEGRPFGVVQLVHGMCEHKERYLPFMRFMAENGYACLIHDHRGHGQSVRDKRDLGYTYQGGAEALTADTMQISELARLRFGNLPLILFGHSMGSMVARACIKRNDMGYAKLIVCGSPSYNPGCFVGLALAKVKAKVQGDRHRSRMLSVMSLGNCVSRFPGSSPNNWISRDAEVIRTYDASKLCGFIFSNDGYAALYELMIDAYHTRGWRCRNPKLPILFVSGRDDPCMINVIKFKRTIDFMRSLGYCNVRGKLYPGMRHEILNEIGREKVYSDLLKYIKK